MPTKTQKRPVRRSTSYKPRTSAAPSRRRSAHRASTRIPQFQRQHLIWGGIGGALLLLVTLPFTLPTIVDGGEAVIETFGVLVPLILVTAAADITIAVRRPEIDRTLTRRMVGAHLLVVFAFGVAALFSPDWTFGDASIAEVSAGRRVRHLLAQRPAAGDCLGGRWPRRRRPRLASQRRDYAERRARGLRLGALARDPPEPLARADRVRLQPSARRTKRTKSPARRRTSPGGTRSGRTRPRSWNLMSLSSTRPSSPTTTPRSQPSRPTKTMTTRPAFRWADQPAVAGSCRR